MPMTMAIVGGDARFALLAELLRAREWDVWVDPAAEQLREADGVIAQNPVKNSALDMATILANLRPDARLILHGSSYCGIPMRVRCTDLMQDVDFVLKNAQLTAEGAVCAAMNATQGALCRSHCLVIGYGRIAQALARMLMGLGARVTVAARRPEMRQVAERAGTQGCDCTEAALSAALSGADFAFSTPPAPLLTEAVLRKSGTRAQIIDLASPPYGVDLAAARALGISAWRESALPGRYCPLAAAQVILEFVEKLMAD